MRRGLVILGVALAIVGVVLLYVPVVPQGSEQVNSSSATPYFLASVSGYSLTGTIAVSVTWTAPSAVEIAAATCPSSCSNPNATNVSIGELTVQNGTSGGFTLHQPNSGYIIMGVVTANVTSTIVTFKITTALAMVGTVLLPLGVVLLILGVVLRQKPRPVPVAAPAPSESTARAPAASPADAAAGASPPAAPPSS